jgi:pimeloyl-ACP methyl ester carboxylesterase
MLAEGMIDRPDGGEVAWAAWGDPEGRPLMVCHGTPGSRLARSANPELYERVGAQVVTFRPTWIRAVERPPGPDGAVGGGRCDRGR